jgi:diguanylate cyclase (GGDEF)-like protein
VDPLLNLTDAGPKSITERPWLLSILAVASIAAIAALDVVTGTEISLTILYVIPVAVIAWYLGRGRGNSIALLAGAAVFLVDVAARGLSTSVLSTLWNATSVVALSWVTSEVLARLRRSLDAERDLARTDPLTGAPNSRSFGEAAALELERVARLGGVFTIAYLDLDHFKLVNDTLGHDTGDRLLRDVAKAFRVRLRRIDTVARIGGDEFVVLLPATDRKAAMVVLGSVRQAMLSLTEAYGPGVRASIGAVTFTEPPDSVDEMLRIADAAMYRAKYAGRDRIVSMTMPKDAGMLGRS